MRTLGCREYGKNNEKLGKKSVIKKYLTVRSRLILLYMRNKPGTAQVGFISKAQKYSRNNNWKNFEIFFQKKYLVKKSHILPKNPKRPFRLIKRFLQTENFKKFKGVPFDRIQKFSEKCRKVPKKTAKGGSFGLPSTFGSIKNL